MELDGDAIAVLSFVLMFVLMLVRVPIGIAMGISGIIGYALVVGWEPALALLGSGADQHGDRL
jgi:C4-dicarboxylate transporter, DctM subunit